MIDKRSGIYVHIPFCQSKCPYCDFSSFAGNSSYGLYFEALSKEVVSRSTNNQISTIYFGGGTPSFVSTNFIAQAIKSIRNNFSISKNVEATIEGNPDSLTADKLEAYRELGFNRISIGMQSAIDSELEAIGRLHAFRHTKDSVANAKIAGFDNISLDLMFGLPGQKLETWERSLESAIALEPKHISTYSLTLDEDSSYLIENKEKFPNEDTEREMYHMAYRLLSASRYESYEISNFSISGFECAHNLDCWDLQEYLGFGMAAHSFVGNARIANTSNFKRYIANAGTKEAVEFIDKLNKEELMSDYCMLALRTSKGISLMRFEELFGVNLNSAYPNVLDKLGKDGLVKASPSFVSLTRKGLDFANIAMGAFM
ncbi:MAG: radical SAM family heme chaperone HemW [Eubacteriaceae bacterium]|nr:radical SAM family heme chaperone HemW [Eubacteriaceae bacterium]